MDATPAPTTAQPVATPFGRLLSYENRALLVQNEKDVEKTIDYFKKVRDFDGEVPIQTAVFTCAGDKKEFQYFQLPGLPRFYLIFLRSPVSGPLEVKRLYELVSCTHVPLIILVHHSAMTNVKFSGLHNFPIILTHEEEDVEIYINTVYKTKHEDTLSLDEREVLFSLRQKQTYVCEQIKSRSEFAKQKVAAREARKGTSSWPKKHQNQRVESPEAEKPAPKKQVQKKAEKSPVRAESKETNQSEKSPAKMVKEEKKQAPQLTGYSNAAKKGTDKPNGKKASPPQVKKDSRRESPPVNDRRAKAVERSNKKAGWVIPKEDSDSDEPEVEVKSAPVQKPIPQAPVQQTPPPGYNPFAAFQQVQQPMPAPALTPEMWAAFAQIAQGMAQQQRIVQ